MGAIRLCALFLCVLLASVSALKRLNNIDDLRNVKYGRFAPRHGLQVLFWFSQRVRNINRNGILTLDSNLNPTRGDYGFHPFRNREGILPSLPMGIRYYIVGNINSPGANALPNYVQENRNIGLPESNMDRLIVSVHPNSPNVVNNVLITAHNRERNDFNSAATYEIDYSIIQHIRGSQICTLNQNNYVINTHDEDDTEDERCYQFLKQLGYNKKPKRSVYLNCDKLGKMEIEIRATNKGYSKLIWKNLPAKLITEYQYVYIDICKNIHTNNTDEVQRQVKEQVLISQVSGTLDTSVLLNAGLQLQLRLYTSGWNYHFTTPLICYGPEFDDANRVLPTRIKGCDASLQLYTEDGKVCARLYIKNTFKNWKVVFKNSWVGFYTGAFNTNDKYSTYQYVTSFEKVERKNTEDYDIYKYQSSLPIAPGFQIRFLLDKNYNNMLARTTPWEGVEEVMISPSDCDNLKPGQVSSYWSSPEIIYRPEFDDANRVVPTEIRGCDASLQLYTKDGKACARLYIKDTFKNWKVVFKNSWVGFYTGAFNANDKYSTYQYVTSFEKVEGESTMDYDIYKYQSDLAIAPGVQIRFLLENYDKMLAQTLPWKGV